MNILFSNGAATFSSSVTATSFIKSGGTSAQILAADGSVITAGTNITISGGTISSSGGGGSVDEQQVSLICQVFG
jgi:3D (Asp-Asp-Asp) domain-containing protein